VKSIDCPYTLVGLEFRHAAQTASRQSTGGQVLVGQVPNMQAKCTTTSSRYYNESVVYPPSEFAGHRNP